jgi:hypothetical protein
MVWFNKIYLDSLDVVEVPREKQRVVVTIPEEILAASAAGPGTTLGGML